MSPSRVKQQSYKNQIYSNNLQDILYPELILPQKTLLAIIFSPNISSNTIIITINKLFVYIY